VADYAPTRNQVSNRALGANFKRLFLFFGAPRPKNNLIPGLVKTMEVEPGLCHFLQPTTYRGPAATGTDDGAAGRHVRGRWPLTFLGQ